MELKGGLGWPTTNALILNFMQAHYGSGSIALPPKPGFEVEFILERKHFFIALSHALFHF